MYKKIDQIEEVRVGLISYNSIVFIPKKLGGFLVYESKSNTLFNKDLDYHVYNPFFLSPTEIIIPDLNKSFFYEFNDEILLYKTLDLTLVALLNEKYTTTGRYNDDFSKYFSGVYSLETKKVIWEKNYGAIPINGYLLGKTKPDNIARLDLLTGEVLWEYSFAHYPKTKDQYGKEVAVTIHNSDKAFTGIVNDQVWVSLNTLQHLVLDIHSGREIAILGQPYDYTQDYYAQKVTSGGKVDEKTNKIISLGSALYREINASDLEVKFCDLREEFDTYGVSSVGDIRLDQDYIYFYDKIFFGNQPRNKVAVLDRKTLKVVWVHDFAQYGTFPMQMEKTDTHLFVLDNGGTLHIFGKEAK